MYIKANGWSVVYKRAEHEDGTLYFPKKLTREFLDEAKTRMGSYIYANQYLNKIIPADAQSFKKEWFKYYEQMPERSYTFAFIDPAIGESDKSDYTGIVIVSVDAETNWYVRVAKRARLSPTQIVNLAFEINKQFKPMGIGIEAVSYQKALVYLISEEMRKRNEVIPLKEVHPGTDRTKEMRILGLVPRYEWGLIYHNRALYDLELELLQFPRASHDDICDSLASLEDVVFYPEKEKPKNDRPNIGNASAYESWYINQKARNQNQEGSDDY